MDAYEEIRKNRRAVMFGAVLELGMVLGLLGIRISGLDPVTPGEVLGTLAMGVALAVPALFALLSLDRRPSLLPAAMLATVVTAFFAPWLMIVHVVSVVIWLRAWNERPVRVEVGIGRAIGRFGLVFLLFGAILALFTHLDPACTQRFEDGRVVSIDPATRGMSTGWTVGSLRSSSSFGSADSGVVEETCVSNTIIVPEALASLLLTGLVLEIGRRWPQGVRHDSVLVT